MQKQEPHEDMGTLELVPPFHRSNKSHMSKHHYHPSVAPRISHLHNSRSLAPLPLYSVFEPKITTSFLTPHRAEGLISHWARYVHRMLHNNDYTGTYSVYSAFDPATIDLQHPQEEVHILLDAEISNELCSSLQDLFSPFATAVVTPAGATAYLAELASSFAAASGEVFSEDTNEDSGNQEGQLEESGLDNENQCNGNESRHGGNGASDDNSGHNGGNDDHNGEESGDKHQGDESSGGKGHKGQGEAEGDEGQGQGGGQSNSRHGGFVQIPFTSTITSKDGAERFSITCNIEAVINEEGVPHWEDGPSLDVKLNRLHITSRSNNYTLSLCQVKIQASLCPSSNANWSPGVVHAVESTKIHKEQSKAGDLSLTISSNPNLHLGFKSGAITGTELTQQPWEITSFPLDNELPEQGSGGMLWKYVRNLTGAFPSVTAENFVEQPSLLLGLDDGPSLSFPVLKIEVVIFWSFKPPLAKKWSKRGHKDPLAPLSLPAHLNFIHRTSVEVDLRLIGSSMVKALNGNVHNQIPETFVNGTFKEFSPHKLRISYKSRDSNLEISIKQAVEGRINKLTEGERSDGIPLSMQSTPIYPTPGPTPPLTRDDSITKKFNDMMTSMKNWWGDDK